MNTPKTTLDAVLTHARPEGFLDYGFHVSHEGIAYILAIKVYPGEKPQVELWNGDEASHQYLTLAELVNLVIENGRETL